MSTPEYDSLRSGLITEDLVRAVFALIFESQTRHAKRIEDLDERLTEIEERDERSDVDIVLSAREVASTAFGTEERAQAVADLRDVIRIVDARQGRT